MCADGVRVVDLDVGVVSVKSQCISGGFCSIFDG